MNLSEQFNRMKSLPPLAINEREKLLSRLATQIKAHQQEIIDVINMDFEHRCSQETLLAEVMLSINEIKHNRQHLKSWSRPVIEHSHWQFYPSKTAVVAQPLGVVGIMAPWNYPFNLVMAPLAAALAAGNRIMIKPSEITSKTAVLIKKIVNRVFSDDQVYVVLGDVEVASKFSQLPLDHILFTGSTAVGKIIMKNAAEHLTPVTLELGGKSPVLIDDNYDLKKAARSIVGGKWFNAGQTCIAPDYILVNPDCKDKLIQAISDQLKDSYPNVTDNPDYTHIINDSHYNRLQSLLIDIPKEKIILPLGDKSTGHCLTPVIVDDPRIDSRLMQEEIFGPILPVITSPSLDASLQFIKQRDQPLTLYLFSNSRKNIKLVQNNSKSGSFSVNETLVQYAQKGIPFGGVGASGMGAYHGYEGFKAMSHMKSIYYQSRLNVNNLVRAPFTKFKEKIISWL